MRMKDLKTKFSDIHQLMETELIYRKEFNDLSLTVTRIKQRLDDDMDIVTRNVREAKDRMGEMTVRFKMACEKTYKLDDIRKSIGGLKTSPLGKISENNMESPEMGSMT